MKFTKMEGCGNDYVYVNGFDTKIEDQNKLSEIVSNRHLESVQMDLSLLIRQMLQILK